MKWTLSMLLAEDQKEHSVIWTKFGRVLLTTGTAVSVSDVEAHVQRNTLRSDHIHIEDDKHGQD